ncbi:MAG: c-type cytochrome [Bacteroidota bacterium]|nr:c-type cytochrome [Bacteroidota bacterium]MDX5429479.1 c-type cytochrome [Bacteroidota bacterium]MDX5468266.1 c-type cytochrome [Bacteroidota bacterium]
MKNSPVNKKRIALVLGLFAMMAGNAGAQTIAETMPFGLNELLWTITLLMGGLLLFLIAVMARLLKVLKDDLDPVPAEKKLTMWEKMLSLRPMADEKSLTMDHAYDGIYELDNPTPPWFNFLFYGTILIGIVYMINYHVLEDGMVQENEYQAELAMWEAKATAYKAQQTDLIDENSVQLVTDAAILGKTADIFKTKCAACHGELGEGKNGPNLTDEYWLHGGELSNVFTTITNGVPEKGMIPWKGLLKPEEIQNMASYILSLKGSLPEGVGKAPEGQKMEAAPAQETPADTATTETASLLVK